MSDLKMDTSTKIITINKAILSFKINLKYMDKLSEDFGNSNKLCAISSLVLYLNNVTSSSVALRTRTTQKHYYAVNPTYATIPPNSNTKIAITFYFNPRKKELLSANGHKFRFEGIEISEEDSKKNNNAKEIFEKIKSKQENNKDFKIKGNTIRRTVEFVFDNKYDYKKEKEEIGFDIRSNLDDNSNLNISNDLSQSRYSTSNLLNCSQEKETRFSLTRKSNLKNLQLSRESGSTKLKGGAKLKEKNNSDVTKLKRECQELKIANEENNKKLSEINSNISSVGLVKDQHTYEVPDVKKTKLSKKLILITFGISLLIGFILSR